MIENGNVVRVEHLHLFPGIQVFLKQNVLGVLRVYGGIRADFTRIRRLATAFVVVRAVTLSPTYLIRA